MAKNSPLVLDGNEVKLRLEAKRLATGSAVHIDWLRFTIQTRNAPAPSVDDLFPQKSDPSAFGIDLQTWIKENTQGGQYAPTTGDLYHAERRKKMERIIQTLPDADFAPSAQAKSIAQTVAQHLGEEFTVHPELLKGQDFYRYRWSIQRNGKETAWVGFLASGDSPRQKAQQSTIHVNISGTACTFADSTWTDRLSSFIEETKAKITRCDLALDYFNGITGGLLRIKSDYENGLMNNRGHRPKCNLVGDWCNGNSRSFYIGSKEAGKQTNIYEKGHQLFGPESTSPWQRIELRYGDKLRVLSPEILRRPGDFFAGASDWHAQLMREHNDTATTPEVVTVKPRRALETVAAEVSRNIRWLLTTAAPSVAMAFQHLGSEFLEIVSNKEAPGRLQAFGHSEVQHAYSKAFTRISSSAGQGTRAPLAFAH
ncbi:MAG: replication initiation factor domain-containing protein [Burkholderiaceae bacterium]|nr:replication initiation factor domain-containing protein [Burkholderiaceae bacterium]